MTTDDERDLAGLLGESPLRTPPGAAPPPPGSTAPPRGAWLRQWLPSKTQVLVLVIGLLTVSNIALWLGLRDATNGPRITVVGVREMTQAYVQKIASPQLSEQESLLRAQMFVAAAQDELHRLVPGKRLVLAKECVLAGEQNDITADLQKAVETKLAQATTGLSNVVGPVQPGAAGVGATSAGALGANATAGVLVAGSRGRVTADALLSPPAALSAGTPR